MRTLSLILLAIILTTGCQFKPPGSLTDEELLQQGAFFRFIDAETDSERTLARQALQRDFPSSPLTARALRLETERAKQKEKTLKAVTELRRCRDENSRQQADNDDLRKDLEQLKQLMIEMERRAR